MLRRLLPPVLALVLVAGGCGLGAEEGDASATRTTVLEEASRSVPVAARALDATDAAGGAGWFECMQNLSWKYEGWARITNPEGDVEAQREAIRAALTDAGYTDVTQVEDHVTVETQGFTIDLQPPGAASPDGWSASFRSDCVPLGADDQRQAEAEEDRALDDLVP